MVIEVKVPQFKKDDIENFAGRVFFKRIDLIGGLNELTPFRTLTWLPSLARASFVVILREEYRKTEDEIAKHVGLTRNSVRNILRAKLEIEPEKLEKFLEEQKEKDKEIKIHVTGSIAKLAYKLVKEGEESQILPEFSRKISQDAIDEFDIPWAYLVLKNTKRLKYPIKNPSELLHAIKEKME